MAASAHPGQQRHSGRGCREARRDASPKNRPHLDILPLSSTPRAWAGQHLGSGWNSLAWARVRVRISWKPPPQLPNIHHYPRCQAGSGWLGVKPSREQLEIEGPPGRTWERGAGAQPGPQKW